MQSERHNAASPIPRIVTDGHADLRINHHVIPDTRRFAGIFPLEVPEAASCGDASHEEQDDTDDISRFEFVAALNKNASTSQVASVATADQSSTLSAAQQLVTRYRAVHGSDHMPERVTTEIGERIPQMPDDQRSMYTLATSSDTQSMMDMMWRPKPKVHMRRADQRALLQAQTQAIAMMNNAGLKPTSKIQCRRRGCADILSDVEALKYHLHIHNIADSAVKRNDTPACTTRKSLSLVESSASISNAPKRSHSRSKSSLLTQHKRLATSPLPRKLSAGSFLPSLFSPRESTPEVQEIPSLTTVARAFTPDPSTNKPTGLLPVCTDETPSANTSTPSRGRRMRKGSMNVSVDTECNPSIAMLLSPPSSPKMRGHFVLAPHAKSPVPVALGSTKDSKSDNYVSFRHENMQSVSEQLTGSRSPMRALSPTRAMSPIRDGIKRILSIGRPDNVPISEL